MHLRYIWFWRANLELNAIIFWRGEFLLAGFFNRVFWFFPRFSLLFLSFTIICLAWADLKPVGICLLRYIGLIRDWNWVRLASLVLLISGRYVDTSSVWYHELASEVFLRSHFKQQSRAIFLALIRRHQDWMGNRLRAKLADTFDRHRGSPSD